MNESQKNAQLKYRTKCKEVIVQFNLENEQDRECYEFLLENGAKSTMIKKLIKEKINIEKQK